mgnify:CR=1 FL=1
MQETFDMLVRIIYEIMRFAVAITTVILASYIFTNITDPCIKSHAGEVESGTLKHATVAVFSLLGVSVNVLVAVWAPIAVYIFSGTFVKELAEELG